MYFDYCTEVPSFLETRVIDSINVAMLHHVQTSPNSDNQDYHIFSIGSLSTCLGLGSIYLLGSDEGSI